MKNLKIKKISRIVILALSINLIFSNIMPIRTKALSGTLAFSGSDGTNAGETIQDGVTQNGVSASSIEGIQLDIFNTNDSTSLARTGSFVYWGSYNNVISPISPSSGVDQPGGEEPPKLIVIKSNDGSEFNFKSIYVIDITTGEPSMKFEGFYNGVSTGSVVLNINTDTYDETFTSSQLTPSIFQNVDEVRISNQWEGNMIHGNCAGIGNIEISDPVTTPLINGLSFTDPTGVENNGKTQITLGNLSVSGNSFKYIISPDNKSALKPIGYNVSGWTPVSNGDKINTADGKYIAVAEVDSSGKIVQISESTAKVVNDAPAVVTDITLADNDYNEGIDGRDFLIGFTDSVDDALVTNYKVYIYKDGDVPTDKAAFEALSPENKIPVKTISKTAGNDGGVASLDSGLITDSKGNPLIGGDYFAVIIAQDNLYGTYSYGKTTTKVKITSDDNTAPIWTVNYPVKDVITKNSIDIKLKINEIGNAYYVCLPSGSLAPTATQVKLGQDNTGTTTTIKGTVALSANIENILSVTSLAPATDYDVYIVADDSVGNLQTTATKITATTSVIPITDFSVTSNTSTTVSFNWPAAIGATGIIIEKSIDNGETWIMASTTSTITKDDTTATVSGLLQDIEYKFRLVVSGGVNAGTSNEVTQKTNEAASVASVSVPSNGTYTVGHDFDFTVNYNEAITVNTAGGTPRIIVTVGSTTKYAEYVSGSGTTALTFRYTVESDTLDSDGIELASIILTNGGILKNASNEDINLTLNNKGNTTLVKVDAVGPKINALNTSGNGTYKLGDKLSFSVSFDEDVNVIQNGSDKPYIEITIGSEVVKAEYDSGTGTSILNFYYTVKSGDKDTNGIDFHYRILLNGGTLEDALGNNSILSSLGTYNLSGIIVDAAAPNWEVDYPQKGTITKNSIDIKVKTDESGNAYFVCLPKGSSQPTVDQIKAGQDSTGTNLSISHKGIAAISANTEKIFSATSLAAATDYDIYVVAEDSLGNLQTSVAKITATTSTMPIIDFTNTSKTTNTVSFNWSATTGATGIIIEQSPVGVEDWTTSATGTLGVNAISAKVTGLSQDTEYKFRLVVTSGTNAGTSNIVTVTTNKSPFVNAVSVPANGIYTAGQNLDFTVNYNEAVTVDTTGGAPKIVVTVGGTTKYADYLSGSGSTNLIFRYKVQSGALDSDGIDLANSILANGGTLKNVSNEDVNLNLTNKGTTTAVLVDAAGPKVDSVINPVSGIYKTGDKLDFIVNFDENVAVINIPYINVTIGTKTVQAVYVSGTGTSTLKFTYTVLSGDKDNDGITLGTNILLNGGTLKDIYGNDAITTLNSIDTSTILVDAFAPIWETTYPKTGAISKDSIELKVKANESGNAYFVCLPKGATQPTAAQVKAGKDSTGTNVVANLKGSVILNTSNESILSATLLEAATDYDIYFVAEDNLLNLQTVATKMSSTTSTAPVADFSKTSKTANSVSLNWSQVTGATEITIEQSPMNVNNWTTAATGTIGVNDTSAKVTGLSQDTEYKFRLVVTDGKNAGASNLVIEKTDKVPYVNSVSAPASKPYKVGENIDFTVNYNEAVTVDTTGGTPRIVVTVGNTTKYANYLSGSGTTALTFRYIVNKGDLGANGVELANQILPNGGALKNSSDETINLNLNNKETTTQVLVDAVGPKIGLVTTPSSGNYKIGDKLDFIVNFDENVTVTESGINKPYVEVKIGSKIVKAIYDSGSGTSALKFTYTILSGDLDSDGIELNTEIALNNESIKDDFGNDATVTFNTVATSTIFVDAVAPILSSASLSTDKKEITLTFSENIFNATNNMLNDVVSFSSNGGADYNSLVNKGSILISGKDLKITFNVALTGSKNKIRIAGSSLKDILGNLQTAVLDTNDLGASINAVEDTALTETNLDGRSLTLTIDGDTFKDDILDKDNFILDNAPMGTSIKSVSYIDSTTCKVILAYNGFDFDVDVTNLSITLDPTEIVKNITIRSNVLNITAIDDVESISIKNDDIIKEGEEDTKVLTVTLKGGQFVSSLTQNNWTVSNLPTGVTKGAVTRVNDKTIEITLKGNSIQDYDSDITNVTVSCTSSEYNDSNGGNSLIESNGVLFTSKTIATVTTSSVTAICSTTATVVGKVVDSGKGTISERGFVYSTNNNPTLGALLVKKIVSSENVTGEFSENLTGLNPNTTYHVRAYVINEEDASYGDDVTFITEKAPTTNSGSVVDRNGNVIHSISVNVITEVNGTHTINLKADEAIVIYGPNGKSSPLGNYMNLGFKTNSNSSISIDADGKIKASNLENGKVYEYKITYDLGGQKIVIGTIKIIVSTTGDLNLTTSLIDPYGVITDADSGKVINEVNVKLYYASTDRNLASGIIPDTEVKLPSIVGFEPNDNKNPQISDAYGAYGFMVFPSTDYYIVAIKDGYKKYISPTISVEQEVVKWDFVMNPDVENSTEVKNATSTKTGETGNSTIFVIGCILSSILAFGISRKRKERKS